MRNQSFRSISAVLIFLFMTGVPTKAGPVVVSDVVQVLSSYQNPPALRLRGVYQNSMAVSADVHGTLVQSDANKSGSGPRGNDTVLSGTEAADDSLLGQVAVSANQDIGVDIIDAGDVVGAVCDCGEIPVKAGGLPWWPLLFLAVVPFFFIHNCDDCDTPTPTPTPLPTPPPPGAVPEPASLLLLGSGLVAFGAGLRRRYTKAKRTAQIKATDEEG